MTYFVAKDANADPQYFSAGGSGTVGNPFVPHHIIDSGYLDVSGTVSLQGGIGVTGTVTIQDGGNSITVDGHVSTTGSVTVLNTVTVIDDGSFNVTVDNASIPVTDNGGSLTVDGYIVVSGTVGVEGTPNVNITNSYLLVSGTLSGVEDIPPGRYDTFGYTVVSSPNNDIDVQFFRAQPDSLVTITSANGALVTGSSGGALFSSSTNTNGSIQAVTNSKTVYRSGGEIYVMFTAAFTAGVVNSYMRIGLFDSGDGLFLGYEGTNFGVSYRKNTIDTTVSKGSFLKDNLTGAADSKFTRNSVPEAIDLSKLNIYRIRFGWLGSAPVYWEVMSPDGRWVTFHETLFPNLQTTPSIETADLPISLDITKTGAGATNLTIQTNCWGAGSTLTERTGIVDLSNSRNSSLLSNGTSWNASGGWTDIHRYSLSTFLIYSSTVGAQGTLKLEFSMNGTTVHRTISYDVADANNHPPHTVLPIAQYLRVSYVADAGAGNNHANFVIQTIHHVSKSAKLSSNLSATINNTTDVDNVRAIIAGQNPGGTYANVGITSGGNLKIALEEYDGIPVGGGVEAGSLRVTVANDSTGLLSVDDNGSSLTVDNTNLDALAFGIQAPSAGLSVVHATGTSLSITIDGDNVGIGGGVQYTEDDPSAGGETGTLILGVRNDAGTTPVTTDGDFHAIQFDNSGRLRVVTQGGAGGTSSVDEAAFTLASDSGTPAMGYVGVDALATGTVGVLGMTADRQLRVVIDADNAGIGGGTQYTEDDASVANPIGNQLVARRRDTPSGETTTDGDVVALNATDKGELYVKHLDAIPVTDNAGSLTVDGFVTATGTIIAITSTVTVTDNGAFNVTVDNASIPVTDNGASLTIDNSTLAVVGGGTEATAMRVTLANDSTGLLSVDDNGASLTVDNPALSVTGGGVEATALRVTIANDSTGVVSVDDNGSSLTVDDGGSSISIDDNAGSITVDNATLSVVGGGTEATALRVTLASDSTGVVSVDDNGASLTVDGTVTVTQSTASSLNAQVAGDVAHDGVDSGNPVKIGLHALAHGTNPTAVAAADRTRWYANRHGIPWVIGGHPNIVTVRANYTAAQNDTAIVTVGAGTKIVVTRCSVTVDNATTVDVAARIGFGTASTPTTTGVVLSHPGIAPGSGVVEGAGAGILGIGADNEDLRITSEVPTTGSIDVVVSYYTIES